MQPISHRRFGLDSCWLKGHALFPCIFYTTAPSLGMSRMTSSVKSDLTPRLDRFNQSTWDDLRGVLAN